VSRALAAVAVLAAAAAGSAAGPEPTGTIFFQRFVQSPPGIQLFSVRADGTRLRQLTRGPFRVDNAEPAASADGRLLAFQHGSHEGDMEISVMHPDGSGRRRLTHCPACRWSIDPSFSPDGRSIVFARWDARRRVGIWRIRSDGTRSQLLLAAAGGRPRDQPDFYPTVPAPKGPFVDQPALSPDGRLLAYRGTTATGQTSIFVATSDGARPRAITPQNVHASRPQWSPDGRWIAFYTTDKDDTHAGRSANIEVIRPDGSGLHALTQDRGGYVQNYDASWSPDGRWIVFVRATDANKPPGSPGTPELYVMRADGSDVRRLVATAPDQLPTWAR
jgi:Tol biopolymer transport system component